MQQLDIFADTLPVQHANALIAALARFDRAACWPALEALSAVDPGHSGLARLRVLCEFVTNWPAAGDEHEAADTVAAIADAERMISERIVPAAAAMGRAGEVLLRRCWSDLARRSEAAGAGPQRFDTLVEEIGDPELARNWRSFQADLDELDATWFPAWCANEKKGGAAIVDNVPIGDGPQAYRLIVGLSRREHGGLCPAVYEDRKRLKQLDEGFFTYYMRHRSDPRQRV